MINVRPSLWRFVENENTIDFNDYWYLDESESQTINKDTIVLGCEYYEVVYH